MGAYSDTEEKAQDTGRMAFRQPGEPADERRALYLRPFWRSVEEKSAYLEAVRNNPRECDPDADTIETPMAYIQRLAAIVAQGPLAKVAKTFPSGPRLNREYAGPRPQTNEGGLSFEDGLDVSYERQPGEEG